MMSIIFNFSRSYLHQKVEAITLKAGYLLSNKICSAGTTCYDICINKTSQGTSVFEKLNFLERVSQNNQKFCKEVRSMRRLMKKSFEAAHTTSDQQVRRREGENLINITYTSFLEIFQNSLKDYGLEEVKELLNDDNFCHYSMNINPEDSTGDKITASDLLQRLLFTGDDNEEEPELFLLGAEFLSDNYYNKPVLYKVEDSDALRNDTIYLHHCFTLYGINELTSDELKRVHYEIKQTGSAFHQIVNQWIDMCYFDDDIPERLAYFRDCVLPAAVGLQKKIDMNETLNNHICLQEMALQTEVWLGEIPVAQLWNYYRDSRVIKDSTWRKLQRLEQDNAFRHKRWPVMMLHIPEEQLEPLTTYEETNDEFDEEQNTKLAEEQNTEPIEEIKATKKYISID